MEKASQDKREKNTSYQPETHVRNASSREFFKINMLTSLFLRNYTNIPLLSYVMPEDIRKMASPVLSHRVVLSPEARLSAKGMTAERAVLRLIAGVPVPVRAK